MSKKRLFQVLDEMNVNDEANKTATCACCFDLVGANKVKQGGHVTMGVPEEAVLKLLLGEYKPMLVLLDMKMYNSIEKLPVEDKLQQAEAKAKRYQDALFEIQFKATSAIFPHLPVETLGAQMCIEIEKIATRALTPKQTTDDTVNG